MLGVHQLAVVQTARHQQQPFHLSVHPGVHKAAHQISATWCAVCVVLQEDAAGQLCSNTDAGAQAQQQYGRGMWTVSPLNSTYNSNIPSNGSSCRHAGCGWHAEQPRCAGQHAAAVAITSRSGCLLYAPDGRRVCCTHHASLLLIPPCCSWAALWL